MCRPCQVEKRNMAPPGSTGSEGGFLRLRMGGNPKGPGSPRRFPIVRGRRFRVGGGEGSRGIGSWGIPPPWISTVISKRAEERAWLGRPSFTIWETWSNLEKDGEERRTRLDKPTTDTLYFWTNQQPWWHDVAATNLPSVGEGVPHQPFHTTTKPVPEE